MLKAELLNRNQSIYYKDNPDRTLSIAECISKIYSDKNTRIRLNLERIVDLRNISTHFITQDYEIKYAHLFQACVINYVEEMLRFHNIDVTESIAQNFLTIHSTLAPLTNEEIRIKYTPEIAEKLIQKSNEIDVLTEEYNSDKFSINIKQNLYITRNKDKADFTVKVEKESLNSVTFVKEYKDPSNTHKYSFENVVKVVKDRMNKLNISINYSQGFNSYILGMFIKFYDIKNNIKYSYKHVIGNYEHYTYSQELIDFIIKCIKEDNKNFVESLKDGIKKR